MPISFTSAGKNETCVLTHWAVNQHADFIDALTWLYLRKPTHAERVMNGLEPGSAGQFGNAIENAIKLLSYDTLDIAGDLSSGDQTVRKEAVKKRDARMAHRDGLLFQHVSWIAARLQFPSAQASPPHVRKADKGFDGLLVDVDLTNLTLSRIVLCEDKASISPRGLVTSSIWPDIKAIVAGERDLEVLDAVTALLHSLSDEDKETVIGQTIWGRARHFRIALTAGEDQIKEGAYNHLFDGYNDNASGDVSARLAEVMPMQDVRKYLDNLANEIKAKLAVL